jgi:hypothetical protein
MAHNRWPIAVARWPIDSDGDRDSRVAIPILPLTAIRQLLTANG